MVKWSKLIWEGANEDPLHNVETWQKGWKTEITWIQLPRIRGSMVWEGILKKRGIALQPMQLHDFNLALENKVDYSPSILLQDDPHSNWSIEIDSTSLTIAIIIRKCIRKCIRKYTKYPRSSHYINVHKLIEVFLVP